MCEAAEVLRLSARTVREYARRGETHLIVGLHEVRVYSEASPGDGFVPAEEERKPDKHSPLMQRLFFSELGFPS
jgi:hypothetical protein